MNEKDVTKEEGGLPPSLPEKKKLSTAVKALIRVSIKLVAVVIVGFLVLHFVICPYAVHGNRMFPKLKDGDCAIVLKIGGYQKGDVVTFQRDGIRYFSRIVAVEGDLVEIGPDGLTINDMMPSEEVFYDTVAEEECIYTVGKDEIFLLNDYRPNDADSRFFGVIKLSELDGKVVFLFRWRGV